MTDQFDWPIKKKAKGEYNIKGNKILATCSATDFFLPGADEWRKEAWSMIRERTDIESLIPAERIDRFLMSFPSDWDRGHDSVNIGYTVENQEIVDYGFSLFLSHPIKWRSIVCVSLLEAMDLSPYLYGVEHVTVGGEARREAQGCGCNWVLSIRK